MKKFIIFAPDYIDNNGGTIALHKLCDLLNRSGYEAYLYPDFESYDLHTYNVSNIPDYVKKLDRIFSLTETVPIGTPVSEDKLQSVFWINPAFNTPVYIPHREVSFNNDWVIIYPEITFGNPLRAKNVVRWFLHNPGFWTGKIYYGQNELYFRYSESFENFQLTGSKTSDLILKILHLPLDIFYENPTSKERKGTAYMIRKGYNRKIIHNLENSIQIDGKSNREIADILRSVKTFISYDPSTLYSNLAVLCGCESVVVPIDGIEEDQWVPNYINYGVAYGFENIEKARNTAPLMREALLLAEDESLDLVKLFAKEANDYFK